MRVAVTVCLLGVAACGGEASDPPAQTLASSAGGGDRAPVAAFVPPSPAGCAGASAYDLCFAIDAATPLAVRVMLPRTTPPNTVAIVRFHRAEGVRAVLDLDHLKFRVGDVSELRLYFQIHPGAYRIAVGVDADGDGNPEGPGDDFGWSALSPDVPTLDEAGAAIVDVGTTPIATTFTLAPRP
jgi:hypothetical protein